MTDLTDSLADIRSEHFLLNNSADEIWPTGECNCGNEWPCDATKLLAAVEAVVAMHRPAAFDGSDAQDYCDHCGTHWPCPTIRALNTARGVEG